MNAENLTLFWESNLLNFLIFTAFLSWLASKFLPGLVEAKNNSLRKKLEEAQKNLEQAEKSLVLAEAELDSLQGQIQDLKQAGKVRLEALKQELTEQRDRRLVKLQNRNERELANLRISLRAEIEKELIQKAFIFAKQFLLDTDCYKEQQSKILQQTIEELNNNPQVLRI